MTVTGSRLLSSSVLLAVIFILWPVSLTEANVQVSSCDKLDQCDFYWGEWSPCSASCTGVKRRSATVCCPPSSATLQLCRTRCLETFMIINSQIDRAPCRCVNGRRRSASGACDCAPGYYGNCCQEIVTDPRDKSNVKDEDGAPPDQLQGDSAKHGCHGSHENHHNSEENCEDDDSDDGSSSSAYAGAVTVIVLVTVGSLVGAAVLIAVLCHKKKAAGAATAGAAGATTGVVVVRPPESAVYTIDVKQNKVSRDVTALPPAYWQAVEASAPPSYQSYMALNEVGLDNQARGVKH